MIVFAADPPPVLAGVRGARSLALAGRVADGVVLAEGAGPSCVRESIERALKELRELDQRLKSPRTRFRQRPKVEEAVSEILRVTCSGAWVQVVIEAVEEEFYKQAKPGRPSKNTQYVREVRERYHLTITVDQAQVAADQARGVGGCQPGLRGHPDQDAENHRPGDQDG